MFPLITVTLVVMSPHSNRPVTKTLSNIGCYHSSWLHSTSTDKITLLKTPLILDVGHREINLKMSRKRSPCWLAYRVPKGAV